MRVVLLLFYFAFQSPSHSLFQKQEPALNVRILGKWYGKYYAFGSLKKTRQIIDNNLRKGNEQVDFIFYQNGKVQQLDKHNGASGSLNETTRFTVGNDSSVYIGNLKYKIVSISKYKLELYSATTNGGHFRLFTRKEENPIHGNAVQIKAPL